ncbi:MAG TPA: ankyrin repeat domain-containing protein [Candidatus Angelobacter sp.]|nr:ankyrin repeat domain-containing protein [Candidatus Angelobacter sp.]
MEPKPLPARPSLEQYKKQAKELLKAYRSADVGSIRRVTGNHPRFEKLAEPEFDISKFALADAQLVIAREHGFESWPKFAKQIEVINSRRAAQSDPLAAFIEAAIWHGTLDAATAILAAHPEIAQTSIHAAAILGDEATVRRFISLDPGSATRKERPFDGDALVYLCLSKYLRLDPSRSPAFLRAATALLDAGADPNSGFIAQDEHGDFETALYGAAGVAHHAELTRLLLERGADPNDNETFYHAPETYNNAALEVLVESGKMNVDNLAGMLLRKADWHDYEGIKYLLEHGADPNRITRWGYTALLQAVRRDNRLENIELLLDHGADPTIKTAAAVKAQFMPWLGPNAQRSAIVIAARRGRGDVLATLDRRGIAIELSGVDRLIAACARNDHARVRTITAGEPHLVRELLAEGGRLVAEFAGTGNTEGVRLLLDLGIGVAAPYDGDSYFGIPKDSTALHVAAWKAWPAVVKLLIDRGAPVNAADGSGHTALALAVRACVDSYWMNRRSPESVAALLGAGASLDGIQIPCGYEEVDQLLRSRGQ